MGSEKLDGGVELAGVGGEELARAGDEVAPGQEVTSSGALRGR